MGGNLVILIGCFVFLGGIGLVGGIIIFLYVYDRISVYYIIDGKDEFIFMYFCFVFLGSVNFLLWERGMNLFFVVV